MKTEKGDLDKKIWERGTKGRVGAWDFSLDMSSPPPGSLPGFLPYLVKSDIL